MSGAPFQIRYTREERSRAVPEFDREIDREIDQEFDQNIERRA